MVGAFEFTTEGGHKCIVGSFPEGVQLSIIPKDPPFEEEILDLFDLVLKHGSAVRVLEAVQQSGAYTTRDKAALFSVKDGLCSLTFKPHDVPGRTFTCDLGVAGTAQLAEFLSATLAGSSEASVYRFKASPTSAKIGRNEPCPCGSGKKYKKCHLGKPFDLPEELAEFTAFSDPYVRMAIEFAEADPRVVRDPDFWHRLGSSLGTSGHSHEALRCFERALSFTRDPEYLLNHAVTLEVLGRHEEALSVLSEVPNDWKRKAIITANILQDKGRHEEAIVQYEKAVEEEPDFFLAYARILDSLKAIDSPLLEYWLNRGIKAVPGSPAIGIAYCYFLKESLRLEELAGADWIDGLSAESGRPDMFGRNEDDPRWIVEAQLFRAAALALVSEDLEDLEDAVSILTAANPAWHFCDPAKTLTATAANLGRPDLVEAAYARICPLCRQEGIGIPRSLVAILARANLRADRYREAVTLCEQALEQSPENQQVLWDYWWALDEIKESAKAVEAAERLYALAPDTADLRYNLGLLCGKIGQFGKAKYYYEEQIAKVPGYLPAVENITFVHLLEGDLSKAEDTWRVFVDTARGRFDGYFVPNADSELMDGELGAFEELIRWKEGKYRTLLDLARECAGSQTYSLKLVDANNATDPRLGSDTTIGRPRYSVEDLIAGLSPHTPQESEELLSQVKAQQRNDFSPIVAQLRDRLPNWDFLPESAQRSLIEGERLWTDGHGADYSPVVITFAKAVEISIKTLLFDSFRVEFQASYDADHHLAAAKRDKKFDRVERFFSFLTSGQHLELGSMALSLELSTGRTAKRLFALGSFADYLRRNGREAFLDPQTHVRIRELSKDYRNPAVHALAQDRESAERARELALTVLFLF